MSHSFWSSEYATIHNSMMNTVFMGSPEFAVPILHVLVDKYQVRGVVTQPDRPSGRGRRLAPPAVKKDALALGLPVIQPLKLRDAGVLEQLQDWAPDFIVVAAYGQILRQDVLELPQFGCINVHASLLPRWRGAAPIQAAILAGDEKTGITIMKMDAGLDSGPLLSQSSLEIADKDTAGTLGDKLSVLGADLLTQTLPGYLGGEILPMPQEEGEVTKAPLLKKENGWLDFTHAACILERQIRAYNPWPGCYTDWHSNTLKVHLAHVEPGRAGSPGRHVTSGNKPGWETGEDFLIADEVQPAGKRRMPSEEFLRGNRDWMTSS